MKEFSQQKKKKKISRQKKNSRSSKKILTAMKNSHNKTKIFSRPKRIKIIVKGEKSKTVAIHKIVINVVSENSFALFLQVF